MTVGAAYKILIDVIILTKMYVLAFKNSGQNYLTSHKFVGKVRPMILRKTLVDIQPNYHHKRYLHETKEKTKTRLISKLSTNLNSNQVLQNSAAYTLYD